MISRSDFIFTIGYEGNRAIVDRSLKKRYAGLSPRKLALEGLFKPAIAAAIYDQNQEELEAIREILNEQALKPVADIEELKNIFGLQEVFEGLEGVLYI